MNKIANIYDIYSFACLGLGFSKQRQRGHEKERQRHCGVHQFVARTHQMSH